MVPEPVRTYLLHDLEAAPLLMARVLHSASDWDRRPDPDRFSLREMIAHVADWEDIWQERIHRIASEDNPFLPSVDEGELVTAHNYAAQDPVANIGRYQTGRLALVAAIRALPDSVWTRPAHREFVGDVDFLQQIAMIVGHDGYHLKQAIEFTG
jgi:hypothetical protein